MQYLSWSELNDKQKSLLKTAKDSADKLLSPNGHKVGCAIEGANQTYMGSTISHPRIIGSTCAERMAIDSLLIANDIPKLCAVVGKLNRDNWSVESLCTPCGLCLEMFWELQMNTRLDNIEFVCANWELDRVLMVKLSELFPRFEAVKR